MRGIRDDFKGLYSNVDCPLGCGHIDNLRNILSCRVIKQHNESKEISNMNFKYEDIFSEDIKKQQIITELFSQLLKKQTITEHTGC